MTPASARRRPVRFWLRDTLKRSLPARWRRRARRLSRLRWVTKARLLRHHEVSWRDRPLVALRYLLLDPEVESFTYEVDNRDELLDFAARALGHDRAAVGQYAAETGHDPELTQPKRRRWDSKRRLPLANRLLWYVAVRAEKPELVVETGVHDGLGSLVLLRALERNGEEGRPGRLLSFDIFEDTGWLVHERLHERWQRVTGSTLTELEPVLQGLRVDMSIHDTPAEERLQRAEFSAVLGHRGERLVVVNSSGARLGVLEELCAREGTVQQRFVSRSRDHVHPGNAIALAVFTGGDRGEA